MLRVTASASVKRADPSLWATPVKLAVTTPGALVTVRTNDAGAAVEMGTLAGVRTVKTTTASDPCANVNALFGAGTSWRGLGVDPSSTTPTM
jgi:hypothetical protein